MWSRSTALALAALLTLGAGCGGGGSDIIENLDVAEQLEDCLADGTGALLALNAAIGVLEDSIASESEPPEGITITPVDGVDNAWDNVLGMGNWWEPGSANKHGTDGPPVSLKNVAGRVWHDIQVAGSCRGAQEVSGASEMAV